MLFRQPHQLFFERILQGGELIKIDDLLERIHAGDLGALNDDIVRRPAFEECYAGNTED